MISLLSIVAIGFFLGMRHATDADHVIAVSTIVSRQQSPWRAALIGGVWGIGHTLTIFAVGMAIILFNLVIPARLGLTMELSVGVTLITLSMMSAFAYVGARSKWFTQRLAIASGLLSLAFGLFLTYQIFFVKGLLTNHPQWTPH